MRIRILSPGRVREKHLQPALEEYLKRLQRYAKVELVTVKEEALPPDFQGQEADSARAREAKRLLQSLKGSEFVVALEAGGKGFTSQDLARRLEQWRVQGRSQVAFVLGGHVGLAPGIRQRAGLVLSLSPLTFTTGMTHLVLLEQLYRSFRIIHGEPYHR